MEKIMEIPSVIVDTQYQIIGVGLERFEAYGLLGTWVDLKPN